LEEETTTVYGLAGLNYATQKVTVLNTDVSNSELGFNLGGGAEFGVGFGSIYLEAKYALSTFDQLAVSGGVRFSL
jgi:opacity protein-like surface antigen